MGAHTVRVSESHSADNCGPVSRDQGDGGACCRGFLPEVWGSWAFVLHCHLPLAQAALGVNSGIS